MQSLKSLYKVGHGPSSSHTIGPRNAAQTFLHAYPNAASYAVTLFGSLALTGRGHLTDKAISDVFASNGKDVTITFDINDQQLLHPNTLAITAYDHDKNIIKTIRYLSIGGGEIIVEGYPLPLEKHLYPFDSWSSLAGYLDQEQLSFNDLAIKFEGEGIFTFIAMIWDKMCLAIERGLKTNGVLPGKLKLTRKAASLFAFNDETESAKDKEKRHIFSYAYAVSEENASGGEIVTAPTCGSSGVIPAIFYAYQKEKQLTDRKIHEALIVAGFIGLIVKQRASISGAECGCQAEIGVACAMAAAGLAYLENMSINQIEYAAEVALEHHLGLTCDPVDGYVQIPCIERNAVCALRAYDAVVIAKHLSSARRVSFDQIVDTMGETGHDLRDEYRETALGGLAKTLKTID